jgi:hypothetical protein
MNRESGAEDFESYNTKHQAFTHLMRISLLQECFCLVGFSGSDPTFQSWIKWVRDIIKKNTVDKTQDEIRIYVIDIDDNECDECRNLFFKNYNIFRIPIMNKSIIDYMVDETGYNVENSDSYKQVFDLLFKFLRLHNDYVQIWKEFDSIMPSEFFLEENSVKIKRIIKLKKDIRISSDNFYTKQRILKYIYSRLNQNIGSDFLSQALEFLILIIKETFTLN